MPGGKVGGGGHSSGGGRIGGGGGRIGGSSFRPSSSSGHRPSGGYTGGYSGGFGGGSFWQGMLFGSMMSNQNRPQNHPGYGTNGNEGHQKLWKPWEMLPLARTAALLLSDAGRSGILCQLCWFLALVFRGGKLIFPLSFRALS